MAIFRISFGFPKEVLEIGLTKSVLRAAKARWVGSLGPRIDRPFRPKRLTITQNVNLASRHCHRDSRGSGDTFLEKHRDIAPARMAGGGIGLGWRCCGVAWLSGARAQKLSNCAQGVSPVAPTLIFANF